MSSGTHSICIRSCKQYRRRISYAANRHRYVIGPLAGTNKYSTSSLLQYSSYEPPTKSAVSLKSRHCHNIICHVDSSLMCNAVSASYLSRQCRMYFSGSNLTRQQTDQRLFPQCRGMVTTTTVPTFAPSTQTPLVPRLKRRKREVKPRIPIPRVRDHRHGIDDPFAPDEDSEEYLKKTSLSPWVPIPDAVARRVFDLSGVDYDTKDTHVDLGSGDGRVCFTALEYGAESSLGIDVDDKILNVARGRLARIHPKPNLEFWKADLMDDDPATSGEMWNRIRAATVVTMYFAEKPLKKFKPILVRQLDHPDCVTRIVVCCGYEMPGWQARRQEVVLGTQIYMYEYNQGKLNPDFEKYMETSEDEINKVVTPQTYVGSVTTSFARRAKKFHGREWPILGFVEDDFRVKQSKLGDGNLADDEDDNWKIDDKLTYENDVEEQQDEKKEEEQQQPTNKTMTKKRSKLHALVEKYSAAEYSKKKD